MTEVLRLGEDALCLEDDETSLIAPLITGDLGLLDVARFPGSFGVGVPSPSGLPWILEPLAGMAKASSAVSLGVYPKVAVGFVLTDPELPSTDNIPAESTAVTAANL